MEEMFKKLSMGLKMTPDMLEKLNELNDAKEELRFNDEVLNDHSTSKAEKIKK